MNIYQLTIATLADLHRTSRTVHFNNLSVDDLKRIIDEEGQTLAVPTNYTLTYTNGNKTETLTTTEYSKLETYVDALFRDSGVSTNFIQVMQDSFKPYPETPPFVYKTVEDIKAKVAEDVSIRNNVWSGEAKAGDGPAQKEDIFGVRAPVTPPLEDITISSTNGVTIGGKRITGVVAVKLDWKADDLVHVTDIRVISKTA